MALTHFLYGCPFCGELPLRGKGPRAHCPSCSRTFAQRFSGAGIQVSEPGGRSVEFATKILAERLDDLVPAALYAREGSPDVLMESTAVARFSSGEVPVRFKGELLGLVERQGPKRVGDLRLFGAALEFAEKGSSAHVWELRDIRALQASSTSIQLSPLAGGVVAFEFTTSSPRLWEKWLEARLRVAWLEEGRGEIVEFQPRIRTA